MSFSNTRKYLTSLVDHKMVVPALKVALVVGTILLLINHSGALVNDQMTPGRWLSAFLSYVVPYLVSIHGRLSAKGTNK